MAAQSHRVADDRVDVGRTVRKLKHLVVKVLVRAHVLVNVAEYHLYDWILQERENDRVEPQGC